MFNFKSFTKRFSCFTDLKSLFKRAKAQVTNFKEYDLEVEGTPLTGLIYFISIYVGEQKLRFQLDSGSSKCTVGFKFIRSLPHFYTGCTNHSLTLNGIAESKEALIEFGLEPGYSKNDAFCIDFGVLTRKEAPFFDDSNVGLIGANFLQFCKVDFRNAKIRVFRDNGAKIKSLLPIEEIMDSISI